MDRVKWSVALSIAFGICAWVYVLLDDYAKSGAYGLLALTIAVLSLHEK